MQSLIEVWCNGSTRDFGSLSSGSSPLTSTFSHFNNMKGSFVFLADGFEETEALATFDVLVRGDIETYLVSIEEDGMVTGAHGVTVAVDNTWSDFVSLLRRNGTDKKDLMVFPGGMPGTKNLAAHEGLMALMREHYEAGGTVAAICAAPGLVVSQLDGLEGKKFTCYDGFEENLTVKGAEYVKAPAVVDGNLITGRGPGCAVDFALAIVSHIKGEDNAEKVRASMML